MSSYRNAPLSTGHDYRNLPFFVYLISSPRTIYRELLHHARLARRDFIRPDRERWQWRSRLLLPAALVVIWMIVLWWGEVHVFRNSVDRCHWRTWERWPENASPHHLVLVADPQLVDPHTYPGRPWPLSAITRAHTDYYMRKSFTLVQHHLNPTTVFFLGDLFDGGREWMPPGVANSDTRWRRYGEDYWMKEYRRFGKIFFKEWLRRGLRGDDANNRRKLVASLPGNHDLGLGNGIRLPVRKRFNAFIGEGNRIDVVGNHTFVSLDTVSLSAKGQPDPATGRQGAGDGQGSNREIWGPVDDFLASINETKTRAMGRAIRHQNSRIENNLLFHKLLDIQDPLITKSVHTAFTPKADIPSILLTHVPLYRASGTPCGPLREHLPPSTAPDAETGEYLSSDPQNAIKVEAGIQYQNVLTPEISREIIERVGDVAFVFSGDDHDYCDVVHRGYTTNALGGGGGVGGIREITVKSFSWAMGVRKPGFLLLSLWNPLDKRDRHTPSPPSSSQTETAENNAAPTLQTHLCLLPDQLSIFIRYALLFALTLLSLALHALFTATSRGEDLSPDNGYTPPLPFSSAKPKSDTPPPSPLQQQHQRPPHRHQANGLAVRNTTTTTIRAGHGYGYSAAALHDEEEPLDERWRERRWEEEAGRRRKEGFKGAGRVRAVGRRFRHGFLLVGTPVLVWWFWLVGGF
ncbi:MAG: hypothetical protein LQ345_001816 [Seirophora villosa]|nr:MAG: hypothetical protein LQ345_001816 [Seirophora villosa]